MAKRIHFQGTCDVCGETISLDYHISDGVIDHKFTADGRMVTWVRHYATAPAGANPNCAVYSSEVIEVAREKVVVEPPPIELDKERGMVNKDDDRPATRDDIIYAVAVIIMVIMLCSASDSCSRRLQINKLREDLQQR